MNELVNNLIDLIVLLEICKDIVWIPAGEVAEAGVDPHVFPIKNGPIWTHKLHLDGLRLVWDAAALIGTDSTVLGPIRPRTDTPRDGEVLKLRLTVDVQAFLSRSKVLGDVHLTRSEVTQSRLFLHHTASIVIRDAL